MILPRTVCIGSPAPDFTVHGTPDLPAATAGRRHTRFSPEAGGQPQVLAFVRDGAHKPAGPEEIAAIRAQLRGLGAALIVLSDGGVWTFRPDDDVEWFSADPSALAGVARQYQVPAGCDAVFVIDGAGIVRFAHVAAGPLRSSLADALDAAGRAALQRPATPTFSRREWLVSSLVGGFALAFLDGCAGRKPAATAPNGAGADGDTSAIASASGAGDIGDLDVVLDINGVQRPVRIDARVSLLDALRERLGLTGTKKSCDMGQCGACTVLVDGRRVNACLTLAVMAQGVPIVTIEGLSRGEKLHPLQQAFVDHDALQCGYCTPGQIMSAVGLLAEKRAQTDDEVREDMSGNLCRCGAYPNIVAAVQAARQGA